jgi:hypothetical protein
MLPFGLCRPPPARNTEAQFIVSDRGDKVNYDIRFVVPACMATYSRLAGRYDNPMPWSTLSPIKGL